MGAQATQSVLFAGLGCVSLGVGGWRLGEDIDDQIVNSLSHPQATSSKSLLTHATTTCSRKCGERWVLGRGIICFFFSSSFVFFFLTLFFVFFLAQVVLGGGVTLTPGFAERVEHELALRAPSPRDVSVLALPGRE